MKTTKPIATISYNSRGYLVGTLKRLTANGFIRFWCAIKHYAEDDEEKEHYHVYIEPDKRVDMTALKKEFDEYVAGERLPRGCIHFRSSKWVDWYWYGLHDKAYLASKGQSRKYHYLKEEMLFDERDKEYFEEMVRSNPNPKADLLKVMDEIAQGATAFEIAVRHNVPVQRLGYFINGLEHIKALVDEKTYRAMKANHEGLIYEGEEAPAFLIEGEEDEEH